MDKRTNSTSNFKKAAGEITPIDKAKGKKLVTNREIGNPIAISPSNRNTPLDQAVMENF